MRGTVGDVEAAPGGSRFALAFLDECAAVATAAGFAPRQPFMTQAMTAMTSAGSKLASSMYRDMTAGAAIEADQIVGDLLARARRLGVETPLLAIAQAHLAVYQNNIQPMASLAAAS
jgi:2-dehydropantoate 2-reductase